MLTITCILTLLLLAFDLSGQPKRVLIKEHHHRHEANDPLPFDLSPYFNDTEWIYTVGEETRSLIGKEFNTTDVEYLSGSGPGYLFPAAEKNPDIEKAGPSADYFATLVSSIRLSASQSYSNWGPSPINYVFELKVDIKNPDGKKAFRESARIPFQANAADYLYGPLVSEQEFESMYNDALKAAFSDVRKLEKRFVKYGRHPAYEGFMAESNAHTLLNKPTGRFVHGDRFIKGIFVLVDDANNVLGQIDISASEPNPEFTEIINLNLSNRLRMTSTFTNSITKEKSTIVAGLNTALDFQFEKKDMETPRLIVMNEQGEQSGKFEMIHPGKLNGEYVGKKYTVNINNTLDIYELFEEQELQGIVQFGPYTKEGGATHKDIVFFRKGLENETLGRLIDLYFISRITNMISIAAIAEIEEKVGR